MASEDLDIWIRLKGARDAAGDVKHVRAEVTDLGRAAEKTGRKSRGMGRGFVYARKGLGPLRAGVTGLTGALGFGAGVGLIGAFGKMYTEAREAQLAHRSTAIAIKRTGASAWTTTKQIEHHSGALAKMSGLDDELIQKGETMMLTFRNVRNSVHGSTRQFDRANRAAVDMAQGMTAMGKSMDVSSAAMQLGKALNDPAKGMMRLQRIGITFSDKQTKQVAKLEKAGHLAAAQGVILTEVEKEFGAQAKSQRTPILRLQQTLNDTAETLGKKLLPYIDKGAAAANKFVTQFVRGAGQGGRFRDKLEQIWKAAKPVVFWFGRAVANVFKFAAAHPALVKVAAALLLASKALKLMRFGGAIGGARTLISVLGKVAPAILGKNGLGGLIGKAGPLMAKFGSWLKGNLKSVGRVAGGALLVALDLKLNDWAKSHGFGGSDVERILFPLAPRGQQPLHLGSGAPSGMVPGKDQGGNSLLVGGQWYHTPRVRRTPHIDPNANAPLPQAHHGPAARPRLAATTGGGEVHMHHHVFQVNGKTLFEAFTEENRKRGNRR